LEEDLQMATVEAFNNVYFNKTNMLEVIKGNIAEVIGLPDASLDEVEARLEELQCELLKKANSKQNYDELARIFLICVKRSSK